MGGLPSVFFNMKKLVLFISLVFAIVGMQAQTTAKSGNTAYVSYSTFNKDTLSYLKTNFDTNKAFYIGKSVSTLLGDLELPVLSSMADDLISNQVTVFCLEFISTSESFKRSENQGKEVLMYITLNQAIPSADIYALFNQIKVAYPNNSLDWTPLHNTFYGGRIIKDIQVFLIDNSQQ